MARAYTLEQQNARQAHAGLCHHLVVFKLASIAGISPDWMDMIIHRRIFDVIGTSSYRSVSGVEAGINKLIFFLSPSLEFLVLLRGVSFLTTSLSTVIFQV